VCRVFPLNLPAKALSIACARYEPQDLPEEVQKVCVCVCACDMSSLSHVLYPTGHVQVLSELVNSENLDVLTHTNVLPRQLVWRLRSDRREVRSSLLANLATLHTSYIYHRLPDGDPTTTASTCSLSLSLAEMAGNRTRPTG
jgi:hypothetical protein